MSVNFEELSKLVIDGDTETIKSAVKNAINDGADPLEIVDKGLAKGIRTVGEKYGKGEIFLTELLMGAETMKAGMEIINPEIQKQKKELKKVGSMVIGTVSGDIHDLGKNIVTALFSAHGFDVTDLGVDVPDEKFIDKIKETGAPIVGLSGFLTLAFDSMKQTVDAIKAAGLRDKVNVMIGGGQITEEVRKYTGADAYGKDAMAGVTLAKKWAGVK